MEENESQELVTELEEVEVPKKRKKIPKVLLVSLLVVFVIIVIIAGGFWYLRSSPQVRHISENALAVAKIDLPRMMLKADFKNGKGQDYEDLMSFLEELNMEALLKDPKSTGLVTAKPAYLFMEYDKKHDSIIAYAVIPIANGEKLATFLKKVTPPDDDDLKVLKKGNKYTIETEEAAVAWNKTTLMVGVGSKLEVSDVQKMLIKYLDQPRSSSIASNKSFSKAHRRGHDISMWLNLDKIADIAYKGFTEAKTHVAQMKEQQRQYSDVVNRYNASYYENYYYGVAQPTLPPMDEPANIFETLLSENEYGGEYLDIIMEQLKQFKDSSALLYLDFDKGKVVYGVKGETGTETRKKLHNIVSDIQGINNLAKYIPRDGLVATTALEINYNNLWSLSEGQINKLIKKNPDPKTDEIVKFASKLFDGSVIIAVNAPGKDKELFYTAIASTKKNQGIEDIVKKMVKEGVLQKTGKNYTANEVNIFFEDGVMVFTTNYREYKKSEIGLDAKEIKEIDSKPLGSFLNIVSLLSVRSDEMDRETEDILSMFTGVKLQSKVNKGVPDELQVSVMLADKKDNSLKVLWNRLAEEDLFKGLNYRNQAYNSNKTAIAGDAQSYAAQVMQRWKTPISQGGAGQLTEYMTPDMISAWLGFMGYNSTTNENGTYTITTGYGNVYITGVGVERKKSMAPQVVTTINYITGNITSQANDVDPSALATGYAPPLVDTTAVVGY